MFVNLLYHKFHPDHLDVCYQTDNGTFNENILLTEFRTWVEKEGFLTSMYSVMVLNEAVDDMTETQTFENYLAYSVEKIHIENFIKNFIKQRIKP